jgi:3-dehydroquinate dehydratase-2
MIIHIINGPNLNLLGKRQPEIYGSRSFEDFFKDLVDEFTGHTLHYFQSNHEGAIIDKLHEVGFESCGIVMNPGGLTHTSVALADAVASIEAPVVEVHISNIHAREEFRRHSYVAQNCVGHFIGLGLDGYKMAIEHLLDREAN